MTDKKVEVKLIRDGVYIGAEELSIGIHSVDAKIAKSWLCKGIAIEPGDDAEDKASVDQAKALTEAKATIATLESKVAELEADNKALTEAKAEVKTEVKAEPEAKAKK